MLSIIIVTYNRNADLEALLSSILVQSDLNARLYEVILVDNSGNSHAKVLLTKFGKVLDIIYISNPFSLPIPWARNIWINNSRYENLLFLDDDNELMNKDILDSVFSDIEYLKHDDETWAIKYTNEDPIFKNWIISRYEIAWIWTRKKYTCKYSRIPHLTCCWVLVKKLCFLKFGLFDVRFEAESDVEFSYRLKENWKNILLNRDVLIRHNRTKNSRNIEWWIVKWVTSHLKLLYYYNSIILFIPKLFYYFLIQYTRYHRFLTNNEIKMSCIKYYSLFFRWFGCFYRDIKIDKERKF
jgi:glycosyltransferase involved in cell wall biosynthesis